MLLLVSCGDREPDASISIQPTQPKTSTPALKTTYPKSYPVKLLTTGEFHGKEVQAQSGEQWLGLFTTPQGFELLPTKVTVSTVRDHVIDIDETKKTGKKVMIDAKNQSIFLVQGSTYLKPGRVKTVFLGKHNLTPDEVLNLSLNSKLEDEYQISLARQNIETLEYSVDNNNEIEYTFSVSYNSLTTQYLQKFQYPYTNRELPHDRKIPIIYWAGDLDRDGKLDFLIDLGNHVNVSNLILFLSSPARQNKIIEPVAQFVTKGC